jgi:TRAP-type C4-dicarboxylate transport system substrate-binding protein
MTKGRVIALLLLFGMARPAAAVETLVFAHLFARTSLQQQALLEAQAELSRRSHRTLQLKIEPDGVLGDQDTRLIGAISVGKADMTFAGVLFAASDYAPIGMLGAPYAFRDYTHWRHFTTSPLAAELARDYQAASGMAVLGYYYYGARQINARRPIATPEGLAGLAIRSPNAPMLLRLFRGLRAKPVPIPIGQTASALAAGTVDAEENPLPTIVAFDMQRAAPYVMMTGHIIDTTVVIISAARLASLSAEQQALVREVFAHLSQSLSARMRQREMDIEAHLAANGLTPVAVDREAFRAAFLRAADDNPWPDELFARLQRIP